MYEVYDPAHALKGARIAGLIAGGSLLPMVAIRDATRRGAA